MEAERCSVEDAIVSTFVETCVDAVAAAVTSRTVSALVTLIDDVNDCMSAAAGRTASTMRLILLSNPSASSLLTASRSCFDFPLTVGEVLICALLGLTRCGGFSGLLCRLFQQTHEFESQPAKYAGFDREDKSMENAQAHVRATGIGCRGENKVQHQVMQGNRDRTEYDRTGIAIGDRRASTEKKYMCMSACQGDLIARR